jgi:CTP:molybdopterin cytidylyltransferase MocA
VRVHALVLAAGQGRRFGGNKLLSQYRGQPLLGYVLGVVASACKSGLLPGGYTIVGSEDDASRSLSAKAGLQSILNDAPELGLSHSLRLGLTALERLSPDQAGAAMVFLGDQPMVRLDVVAQLINAYRHYPAPVLRPRYLQHPDVPGHPTLLDRSIWHLAQSLQGDHGIAGLLTAGSIETVTIDVGGDNPDIDTPADLLVLEEPSR